MTVFQERSDALTGSACLKKAINDHYQDNSKTWEHGQSFTNPIGNRRVSNDGLGGIASLGEKRGIRFRHYDGRASRRLTNIGYIGENRLDPNQPFTLNEYGNFEPTVKARGSVQ